MCPKNKFYLFIDVSAAFSNLDWHMYLLNIYKIHACIDKYLHSFYLIMEALFSEIS